MKVETTAVAPQEFDGEAIVVGVWSEGSLPRSTAAIDQASGGVISRLIELKEISTARCDVTPLLAPVGVQASLVVVVGLGSQDDQKPGLGQQAAGAAAKYLASRARKSVGFYLDLESAETAIAGAMVGCVGQDLFRTERNLFPFDSMSWHGEIPWHS